MKKILVFLFFPVVVFLLYSCAMDPARGKPGIDSIEDAERATRIVFEASYSGISECHGPTEPSEKCITLQFQNGGILELCLAGPEVLSGSQFYDELDFSKGMVFQLTFSDVVKTCPETGQEYTLNGDLAFYGTFSFDESAIDIVFVMYGAVEIDGEDFSDTAEIDVKYSGLVEYSQDGFIITGSVEGTVNDYEIDDMDWEYTIPL